MDERYICYCGLYCENCAVKAKIWPASKTLYDEMTNAGFGEIIKYIPGGEGFWPFLKNMAERGLCGSCKEGGGNPGCVVRKCAKEKGLIMCAFCDSFPCENFTPFISNYPTLEQDNALAREKGLESWSKLQDERRAKGFTYTDARTGTTQGGT